MQMEELLKHYVSLLPENIISDATKQNPDLESALKIVFEKVYNQAYYSGRHEGICMTTDIAAKSIDNGYRHFSFPTDLEKGGKIYSVWIYVKEKT
jgi:hypothetical protein